MALVVHLSVLSDIQVTIKFYLKFEWIETKTNDISRLYLHRLPVQMQQTKQML